MAVLEAIASLTAELAAARIGKALPPRVMEPPAHDNCYCYVDQDFLEDGQPVEVWMSILIPTTCEVCEGYHETVISQGPWFGDTV